MNVAEDFTAVPSAMQIELNKQSSPEPMRPMARQQTSVTLTSAHFVDFVRKNHPEILDPLGDAIFEEPVVAEDGYRYEKRQLERWIRSYEARGEKVRSTAFE